VGGVKSGLVVSGPDDLIGMEPDVGECVDGVDRVGDDLVAAVLQPGVVGDLRVVPVGRVDIPDLLLLPDPVRDPDDVIDYVGVLGLEAAHALRPGARGVPQQPLRAALLADRDVEVAGHRDVRAVRVHRRSGLGFSRHGRPTRRRVRGGVGGLAYAIVLL
jgi:hypothetical protein